MIWEKLGKFILRYRILLLILLAGASGYLGIHAASVQLSYDFSRAIPINNPKYKVYQEFRQKFGEDGNLLVIAIQTDSMIDPTIFNAYSGLVRSLKKIQGVDDIISVPTAIDLVKDTVSEKLKAIPIFPEGQM